MKSERYAMPFLPLCICGCCENKRPLFVRLLTVTSKANQSVHNNARIFQQSIQSGRIHSPGTLS